MSPLSFETYTPITPRWIDSVRSGDPTLDPRSIRVFLDTLVFNLVRFFGHVNWDFQLSFLEDVL